MGKFRGFLKSGLYSGIALALLLSGTACGKDEELVVDDYVVEDGIQSDTTDGAAEDNTGDDVAGKSDVTNSGSGDIKTDGRSLTDIYGESISANDSFSVGDINASFNLSYKVPEAELVNVYEGTFIDNSADIEKQVVHDFFGGTEKDLTEIKYENDTDYIMLLYKYRTLEMVQKLGGKVTDTSSQDYREYMTIIDSSFDKTYTWADEDGYYIHMYEGEYSGIRYGMIYSYDKVNYKRNIYVCPISIAEYFPDFDAKTMFVIDNEDSYGSDNLCTMSEADIKENAGAVLGLFGLSEDEITLSLNPTMDIPEMSLVGGMSGMYFSGMPKLLFSDSDMMASAQKINSTNPAGRTYDYRYMREQPADQRGGQAEDTVLMENGYAVYLCSEPFAENITPQAYSTFNRGSIFYTDKGLFTADISLVADIDNVVQGVELLSFDNIKESFKDSLANDPKIIEKSSKSLEVISADFTYVLIEDKENNNKATFIPAWYFVTKDKKLKSGETSITYDSIINAIDGSDLKDAVK